MEGWIKLHRKLLENDLWKSEPFTRGQAWVDLILLANHKDSFFYKRGNKVIVLRGQVGRSIVELSDRWSWSRSKVNKFLKDLEKEQQIEQQKNNVTQIVTILNYDLFQEKEQQIEQQKSNRKTSKEQQKDTYKNVKNVKEEKPLTPKGEFDFDMYLKKINELFGKSLRVINDTARRSIKARLKEGYTKNDIWNSMQNVANDNWHKEKNYVHCTPQYFSQVKVLDMHSHTPKKKKNQIGATTEYYQHD